MLPIITFLRQMLSRACNVSIPFHEREVMEDESGYEGCINHSLMNHSPGSFELNTPAILDEDSIKCTISRMASF